MTELQRATDCWAQRGAWVFEPAAFYGNPRGNMSRHACPILRSSERINELGYQWVPPADCHTEPYWRGAALLSQLHRRLHCASVLLVGDSMQRILGSTLRDMIRTYRPVPSVGSGAGEFNFTFVFNAHLALNTEWRALNNNNTQLNPWVHLLHERQWNVIVLNRGQHQVPNDLYLPELRATLSYVRRANPGALIIVRTTPVGHVGCETMRNAPPLAAAPTLPQRHFWSRIPVANDLATRLVRDEFAQSAVLMDVVPATSLRADSHVVEIKRKPGAAAPPKMKYDCVHYCIPGPVDMWAELLGNMLLLASDLGIVPTCSKS